MMAVITCFAEKMARGLTEGHPHLARRRTCPWGPPPLKRARSASPALSRMFHLLLELISGDSQKVEIIKELERQETWSLILGYANGLDIDPKLPEPIA
jgi:hypothetical protein